MNDSIYFRSVFEILSAASIPATETARLRMVADIMDETATRGNAAMEAEEKAKAEAAKGKAEGEGSGGDVA